MKEVYSREEFLALKPSASLAMEYCDQYMVKYKDEKSIKEKIFHAKSKYAHELVELEFKKQHPTLKVIVVSYC